MNYFASCLYGDYEKYKKILDDLHLQGQDRLWLIGDVIDGNETNPEDNLKILDDIMQNENVKLILGDHEYAHNMRYVSMGNIEGYDAWVDYLNKMDVSGQPFNEYIEMNMSMEEQKNYFGSFLLSLELSEVVLIGDRYFYLVHGTPSYYIDSRLPEWQLTVCTGEPDLLRPNWNGIKTDPMVYPFLTGIRNPISSQNTIIISGQTSSDEAAASIGKEANGSGIYYMNHTLCIGRKGIDEPVPVVGIDAAGFFIKGIY